MSIYVTVLRGESLGIEGFWGETYTLGDARGWIREELAEAGIKKPTFVRHGRKTCSSPWWTVTIDGIEVAEITKI